MFIKIDKIVYKFVRIRKTFKDHNPPLLIMTIRKPAVSGTFYPSNKNELSFMINSFLEKAQPTKITGKIKAIIAPHAGYVYSGQVAAYAYKLLEKTDYNKIIIIGPAHTLPFKDIAADDNYEWETPLGIINLIKNNFTKLPQAHYDEHCLEVQVPFLQTVLKDFKILPLVAGDIHPKKIAEKIIPLLDEKTLVVISTDLSHYNPYETAEKLDKTTINKILSLDFEGLIKGGDACGIIPILAMVEIAKQLKWKPTLLRYQNSGDVSGDKSHVVGYASIVFTK